MNAAGTEFGRGRLAQIVRSNCRLSADGLILEIFKELDKFSTVAFDDQSVSGAALLFLQHEINSAARERRTHAIGFVADDGIDVFRGDNT